MRDIKFRAWDEEYKTMDYGPFWVGWNGVVYESCKRTYDTPNTEIEESKALFSVMQFTGLTDKSGVEIYEGDILNICFTSDSGEHIHDGVYSVSSSALGGIQFDFIKLFWISYGYNQYYISSTLCEKYGKLSTVYANEKQNLIVPDKYKMEVNNKRDFPFNNHKELSFNSRYFEVIGNIHENPELLEEE